MTTSPIVTITDELLADIKEECALATELDCNAAVVPAHISALLAHIVDLKQQAADREAHVRNLIDSETLLFNYLADIRQAVGDDGRLMLPGLVEHIRGMSQQLVAAGVTSENCELFRKDADRYAWLREMHNDEYGTLWVSRWDYEKTEWVSLDAFCRPDYDGELDLDAAIDAARSAGKDG